ncbi:hypothetical protein SAMN05421823_105319 [Catalinimonas alkaloidigena]|uniref:Uncharacterized protein n=1 Tax=Catalinimonas alkaloidigena TaxID=1075417 RepID=A0A1G9JH98_9BACT|nr:hypothetical protein [Catalinimonas alkaloidigena]SDL36969.1 hypothetical protein SAMN05421823_105319 [Catalinimonas alkaloidigena]
MASNDTEMHPYLPSGEWEGFYCYGDSPKQHKMAIELRFAEGVVSGSGVDDVAPFAWKGTYTLDAFRVSMTKTYPTHQIAYQGDVDENGIWGMWDDLTDLSAHFDAEMIQYIKSAMHDKIRGGFHIWPKKATHEFDEEALTESKKLAELFVEKIAVPVRTKST